MFKGVLRVLVDQAYRVAALGPEPIWASQPSFQLGKHNSSESPSDPNQKWLVTKNTEMGHGPMLKRSEGDSRSFRWAGKLGARFGGG